MAPGYNSAEQVNFISHKVACATDRKQCFLQGKKHLKVHAQHIFQFGKQLVVDRVRIKKANSFFFVLMMGST